MPIVHTVPNLVAGQPLVSLKGGIIAASVETSFARSTVLNRYGWINHLAFIPRVYYHGAAMDVQMTIVAG